MRMDGIFGCDRLAGRAVGGFDAGATGNLSLGHRALRLGPRNGLNTRDGLREVGRAVCAAGARIARHAAGRAKCNNARGGQLSQGAARGNVPAQ